ncbi:DUF421 domain-containing protein [Planomicrobium chinense]|uniref:DUF421 domain-containing protein n=1 Tax=Planococcus chinensis TaxID=272917 RepID=UPI001CC5310B|nr:YetF domain-containing protein [Planococcus chinensis]MBZ5202854.1 DUF421 domain-containing protein [Planococcus chinensis]
MFEITLQSFIRIATVGTLAYIGLIILLRISRKRTLSQLNMFDFVITVAFGSVLSTILLNSNTSLLEGLLAFALLVLFQFIITFLSVRSKLFSQMIKAEPTLLFQEGQFYRTAMKTERVTEDEMLQSVRKQGIGTLEEVKAIVLETDGTLSIIKNTAGDALSNVKRPEN